ncbi:MAG: LuxR C-terminal-related transcriptional regulator [Myxococcota bacterium]
MPNDGEDVCVLPQTEMMHPDESDLPRRFVSSDEFFGWLRDHLVEEGRLTEAEEETCELLLLGRNYLEIAAARRVSIETIKWHVKRILRKLGVGSTRELLWVVGYRIDRKSLS